MKKIKFVTCLLLLLSSVQFAQVDRSIKPKPGPAPEIKIGDYESFQLENGMKVYVVENDKLPRVTFSMVFDHDLIFEADSLGYVSFAGQLLRRGTTNRTKAQIDEEIDFIGASLSTSSSMVSGGCLKKHVDNYFEIFADIVLNPSFPEEELEKIRTQTLSGLKIQKDDPNEIAANVRNALVYGKDHPKGEILTEETVEAITIDACKSFYETYISPSCTYLAIVGDIDLDEAKELVEKYFDSWQAKEIPSHEYEIPKKPLVRKVALVDRPASVQSVIHVAYPIELKIGSEDALKVNVLNKILGGTWSRLDNNIREDKGWAYYARASMSPDRTVARFDAFTEARNEVTDSVITEILAEMEAIKTEKVSDDELQLAKNYLTGSFSRSLESPGTIAGFAINIARHNMPKDYYKNYLKNLNAVTADDVMAMAKKYIKPNNAHIIVVGKADDVADDLKKFSLSGKVKHYDIYANEVDPTAKKIPAGLTAEKVIQDYIDAVGGEEKLKRIEDKTTIMKGKIQNFDITLTINQKAPNKLYQFFDAGVMQQTTVFDGEKGKQAAMGKEEAFEGDKLEEMKLESMLNLLLVYKEKGIKAELKGVETIEGKDAYKLVFTLPYGKEWIHYFDSETGLKVREVQTIDTPQGSFTQTVDMKNYKEVDGMKFAHTVIQSMGPQKVELNVESIEINTGLKDSVFEVD
jgi:zinc protease